MPEQRDLRGGCSPQRRRAGCPDGTGAPLILIIRARCLRVLLEWCFLTYITPVAGRGGMGLGSYDICFNEPLLSANPLKASIRIIYGFMDL